MKNLLIGFLGFVFTRGEVHHGQVHEQRISAIQDPEKGKVKRWWYLDEIDDGERQSYIKRRRFLHHHRRITIDQFQKNWFQNTTQ